MSVAVPTPLVRVSEPKLVVRKTMLKSSEGYGISRTTLAKKWTITEPNVKGILKINGVSIDLPFMDGTTFETDKIRQYIRDIIPMTQGETALCAVESAMFASQITATEYYRYFPSKKLFDLIFTGDMAIYFKFEHNSKHPVPENVAIEEEYALSESQVQSRLNAGETLESLDSIQPRSEM